MMSELININSAGGTQAGPGNPPEQSSPDGSSAGAQYLQAPNSSTPTNTNTIAHTHLNTLTRQRSFDLSLSDDTNDGLSGVGKLQIYETDEEDIRMVSSDPTVSATPTSDGDVASTSQGGRKKRPKTDEQKREEGYKRSLRFLRKMEGKNSSSLTTRDKRLIRKHNFHVTKYESSTNTTVVEVIPPTAAKKDTTKTTHTQKQKHTDTTQVGERPTTSAKTKAPAPRPVKGITAGPKTLAGPISEARRGNQGRINPKPTGKERPPMAKTVASGKRQRSSETKGPDGKRVKKSTSLSSAPDLQVAILDRSNPEGKLSTERWLKVEESILRSLSEAVIQCEDDSFTAFDGARWQKGVKIIGCGNKKALDFLTACINGLDPLWPGMKVEIVPIDQIPSWTTVRVWIPPPVLEDEAILRLVKVQNKCFQTQDWSIVRGRARDKGDGKDLWIRVLASPEALAGEYQIRPKPS